MFATVAGLAYSAFVITMMPSLWDVDDRATAAFVERFHATLRKGVTPAEDLRATQAWMRAQKAWSHPSHWAGWQLWGPAGH